MIYPAPTSSVDPSHARGVLVEYHAPSGKQPPAPTPGSVVLTFSNTSYQMHLTPTAAVRTEVGKRILGIIRVKARRVDEVHTGGRYVEPVYGRPRRVQGTVVSVDPSSRTLVVDAGVTIHLELTDARQQADAFNIGSLVSCDVLDGGTFTPISS